MDAELNKRLIKLKATNAAEFHVEMKLQKTFNEAVTNQCNKDCGSGGTMRGIPYNFCRIAAYKYRTTQAIQINNNKLSIPVTGDLLPDKRNRIKQKDTKFYTTFAEKLCEMPHDIWENKNPPADCQKNVLADLDSFDFTYDVCDLS